MTPLPVATPEFSFVRRRNCGVLVAISRGIVLFTLGANYSAGISSRPPDVLPYSSLRVPCGTRVCTYSLVSRNVPIFCRLDSLAAGACFALAFAEKERISKRGFELTLLAAMIASGLLCLALFWKCGLFAGTELRSTTAFAILGYTLLSIFFAATTGVCMHWSGRIWFAALRWKPIAYIGKISHSMYLIHIPIYVAVGLLWGAHTLTYRSQILHGVAAALCTMLLAALSWKYFESPILAIRDRPFSVRALRFRSARVEASAGDQRRVAGWVRIVTKGHCPR